MNRLKQLTSFRLRASLPVALGLIAAGSLALTLFMFYLQPNRFLSLLGYVAQSNFLLLLLNWLPIVLSMLTLYFLFGNVSAACAVPAIVITAMSLINRGMIAMRAEPFKPLDILLGAEVLGIAKSIDKRLFVVAGALICGLLLVMALAMFVIRNARLRPALRVSGVVLSVAVFYLVNRYALASTALYESFHVEGNRYNLTDNFLSKGFLYSFINLWDNQKITKPPGYDMHLSQIKSKTEMFTPDAEALAKPAPHIIMILAEAFSTFSESPHLSFEAYTDPLVNYRRIKENAVSGTIIVPNIGGGTSDTEFDIFTGISTRHFRDNPYSFSFVNKSYQAMPRWLAAAGYRSIAMHPGYGWFYNRQTVYPHLGFSEFIDMTAFDGAKTKGGYITEQATVEKIIELYAAHVDAYPNTPLFEFCISIQNHGPYIDKYGAELARNFDSDLDFSADAVNALSNYFEGLTDVDRELGVLTDYLERCDEPVVLVFFGDHIPSFTHDIYDALIDKSDDSYDELTRLYRAPFIVWQNAAARESLAMDETVDSGVSMSSNYFGAYIMRLLGYANVDAFVDYLNELYERYPVVLESLYAEYAGDTRVLKPFDEAPEELSLYRSWEYFRVKGQ